MSIDARFRIVLPWGPPLLAAGLLVTLLAGCSTGTVDAAAATASPGPPAASPEAVVSPAPTAAREPDGQAPDAWPRHPLAHDRDAFHALLAAHGDVRRTVELLPDGVATLTESDDPAVAARIVDHVEAMAGRLADGRRLRQWDPLFVALFDRGEGIELSVERTGHGVRVRETSADPQVVALIQAHAGAVDGFVARGFDAVHEAHPVPASAGIDVDGPAAGGRPPGCGGCCGREGACRARAAAGPGAAAGD